MTSLNLASLHEQKESRAARPRRPITSATKPGVASASPDKAVRKKLMVFDTNVPLVHPGCYFAFGEHDVFQPLPSMRELDSIKTEKHSSRGFAAREAARMLFMIKDAAYAAGDVPTAPRLVPLAQFCNGKATGSMLINPAGKKHILRSAHRVDDVLVEIVEHLREQYSRHYSDVVLVTNDINLSCIASGSGISTQWYTPPLVETSPSAPARALPYLETFTFPDPTHKKDDVVRTVDTVTVAGVGINQFFTCPDGLIRVLDKKGADTTVKFVASRKSPISDAVRIVPKNQEQEAALELLLDSEVGCVALEGVLGSGKTLLALAAALELVRSNIYKRIAYVRSVIGADEKEEIGYLPGSISEKTEQWKGPIADSFRVIETMNKHSRDDAKGNILGVMYREIQFQPLSFIQGRTFHETIVIVDEVQNLSAKMLKLVLGRAARDGKIILLGDITQVTNPDLTAETCGLARFLRVADTTPFYGAVHLPKCLRSDIAELAARIL